MNRETRTERSRDLRQRQTYAETKLWKAIRGGRLDGLLVEPSGARRAVVGAAGLH